jgi:hypothetical protein
VFGVVVAGTAVVVVAAAIAVVVEAVESAVGVVGVVGVVGSASVPREIAGIAWDLAPDAVR